MEALYRKYRPLTFADVVGQEHIERTLKNAIEQNKVSHAYLFCGPRGTGKTTMARILAKALMCEQGPTTDPDGTCPECEAIARGDHPDVYELDAASRTGVDNVREEIIGRVNYAPTRGQWKVYIIDEVHMLSTAAFNALLKTLEEPPAHVVFILCTTDPQKVPETIQSRCQRFDFRRISNEAIVARLGAVCVEEGVDFEGEALDLIAYRADGGMRNALTSLEQLIAFGDGHVTLEGAQNLLGALDDNDLSEIVDAVGRRDAAVCFAWVDRYVETGSDLAQFVGDFAEYIRNLYLMALGGSEIELPVVPEAKETMQRQLSFFGSDRLAFLMGILGDLTKELRSSTNPRLAFEIALTRMVRPDSDVTIESLAARVEELESRLAALEAVPVVVAETPTTMPVPVEKRSSTAQVTSMPAGHFHAVAPERPSAKPALVPDTESSASRPVASGTTTEFSAFATSTTCSVDLANPAALQRLWHATTSAIRKANPARGVLFMNAKIFPAQNGQGIVVEFSKDNAFAYNAARKPEVQQLLAQTLSQIAGGTVPFQLTVAAAMGTEPSSSPSTTRPASVAPSFAANPVAPAFVPSASEVKSNASEPVASPQFVSASSQSDLRGSDFARVVNAPESQPAAPTRPSKGDSTSTRSTETPTPQVHTAAPSAKRKAAAATVPATTTGMPAPPRSDAPLASAIALPGSGRRTPLQFVTPDASGSPYGVASSRQAPAVPAATYEDETYEGGVPDDYVPFNEDPLPAPTTTDVRSPSPSAAPAPVTSQPQKDFKEAASSAPSDDEARQIVDILTDSFGSDIKFEELP